MLTQFTDKQIEILNDLLTYDPSRRQWDQGVVGPAKGLGTILAEMNAAIQITSETVIFRGGFDSLASEALINLYEDDTILQVSVVVTEEFTDPSAILTIGTHADPTEVMSAELSNLNKVNNYVGICNTVLDKSKDLRYFLSPGASTAGKFDIILTFEKGND